jgi:hypothetical protein
MTNNQHAAQQTRRFNEYQERQNRAAGIVPQYRVEDALIDAHNDGIEAFELVSRGPVQVRRSPGTNQWTAAIVAHYRGGDGRQMHVVMARHTDPAWAGEQVERDFARWLKAQEAE